MVGELRSGIADPLRADFADTLAMIRQAVDAAPTPEMALQRTVELIHTRHATYQWVGVYILRGGMLELGPYLGAPTEHTRIPVGSGVCGTAVARRANQVIEDVTQIENYLACSPTVRSEIVVLIWRDGDIVGELDVDCDQVGAFGAEDERFLSEVAKVIARSLPE